SGKMERIAKELSGDRHRSYGFRQRRNDGQVRRTQPSRLEASHCGRHAAASVPATRHGSVPESVERGQRRDIGDERRLQKGPGFNAGIPQRRGSVVASRGIYLRRLHDPHPNADVKRGGPANGGVSLRGAPPFAEASGRVASRSAINANVSSLSEDDLTCFARAAPMADKAKEDS